MGREAGWWTEIIQPGKLSQGRRAVRWLAGLPRHPHASLSPGEELRDSPLCPLPSWGNPGPLRVEHFLLSQVMPAPDGCVWWGEV